MPKATHLDVQQEYRNKLQSEAVAPRLRALQDVAAAIRITRQRAETAFRLLEKAHPNALNVAAADRLMRNVCADIDATLQSSIPSMEGLSAESADPHSVTARLMEITERSGAVNVLLQRLDADISSLRQQCHKLMQAAGEAEEALLRVEQEHADLKALPPTAQKTLQAQRAKALETTANTLEKARSKTAKKRDRLRRWQDIPLHELPIPAEGETEKGNGRQEEPQRTLAADVHELHAALHFFRHSMEQRAGPREDHDAIYRSAERTVALRQAQAQAAEHQRRVESYLATLRAFVAPFVERMEEAVIAAEKSFACRYAAGERWTDQEFAKAVDQCRCNQESLRISFREAYRLSNDMGSAVPDRYAEADAFYRTIEAIIEERRQRLDARPSSTRQRPGRRKPVFIAKENIEEFLASRRPRNMERYALDQMHAIVHRVHRLQPLMYPIQFILHKVKRYA